MRENNVTEQEGRNWDILMCLLFPVALAIWGLGMYLAHSYVGTWLAGIMFLVGAPASTCIVMSLAAIIYSFRPGGKELYIKLTTEWKRWMTSFEEEFELLNRDKEI
jgi:hypothetical protein